MVAIEGQGIPLTGIISPASTSEFKLPTSETVAVDKRPLHPITKPKRLIADCGYDAKWVREKLRAKGINSLYSENTQ